MEEKHYNWKNIKHNKNSVSTSNDMIFIWTKNEKNQIYKKTNCSISDMKTKVYFRETIIILAATKVIDYSVSEHVPILK